MKPWFKSPCSICFLHLLIRAEDVKGQRFVSLIDEVNGVIHVTHGDYGKERPKDLLLHQSWVRGDIFQHSWGCMCTHEHLNQQEGSSTAPHSASLWPPTNVALWDVTLPAHHRGVALHQTHHSVEVSLVDDSAVVWGAFGISAIKLLRWI